MFMFIETRVGRLLTLASALAVAPLVGCDEGGSSAADQGVGGEGGSAAGGSGGGASVETQFLSSDLEREQPQVPLEDVQGLAAGQNQFALELFQNVRGGHDNLFFSPLSIHQALGMTWAGARGQTEADMASTMHFDLGQDGHHMTANALSWLLASRAAEVECAYDCEEGGGDPFELSVVNRLWGQRDYAFLPEFLDVLALNYGAGLAVLDFATNAEAARTTINDWVEVQTHDRIQDLLPEGSITGDTRLVLTNAIYFKASWGEAFSENATADADFTLVDGATIQTPTMVTSQWYQGHMGPDYDAIRLPYMGEQVSMVLIAPPAGELEAFEADLTAEGLAGIIDGLAPGQYEAYVPKFTFETSLPLTGPLQEMGMAVAFGDEADFSGMTGDRALQISDVLHKAFVAIDEEGTEAAAATAVVVGETSVPVFEELRFDRPFLFVIIDEPTGALLFMGRLADPR